MIRQEHPKKPNYSTHNYCKKCKLLVDKTENRCSQCGQNVRTGPRRKTYTPVKRVD